MKLLFAFAFLLLTHVSYAQIKLENILSDVIELNEDLLNEVYIYDETSETMNYQMFFIDEGSFSVFTHFKSSEDIFDEAFKQLQLSGVIEQILELGVNRIKFLIKNESTGDVFVSRLLDLTTNKIVELPVKTNLF